MRIGFDVSPLYSGHKVRGIGFYTQRLLKELKNNSDLMIIELKSKTAIRTANYDLLHIPYFHPYFFTLPFFKKKPTLVTVHDLIPIKYPKYYPPGIRGYWRWQIQKRLLRKIDLIITDSFASKQDLVKLVGYPKERIRVIYLAAGEEFKKLKSQKDLEAVRKKYQLPEKFVLYVGDVNWNKNIPGLVRACEKIKAPLVIVGKQAVNKNIDPNHPENKDLVWLQDYFRNQNLKIRESKLLNLVGFVPTKDLVALYNLATVYCQPSFDEGFGLPVLEAMSCGCPVVSSNRGSLPEVVGNAGLLVEPTVEGLAAGIKKLLQNYYWRRKYSLLGLKRAKEFSWEKTTQETLAVYKQFMI